MPTLPSNTIATLLTPYLPVPSQLLLDQLSTYLDVLMKWNARTNLSAIRSPEQIVQRHFGESLFAARHLPPAETLLDLGSGAGFPGLPIALAHPNVHVTLAESQNKKSAFLREVVRTLGIPVEVWGDRAESIPASRRFDVVTLRAVDRPAQALTLARELVLSGGAILQFTGTPSGSGPNFPIPLSRTSFVEVLHSADGTA